MKKFLLILGFLLLLGVGWYFFISNKYIPNNIVLITDNYIINKVGQIEFKANYIYDHSKSYKHSSVSSDDYSIYYEYKPASKASGKIKYLVAHVSNEQVEYMNGLYTCDNPPCKIKIDKEGAINIAKKQGFLSDTDITNMSIYLSLDDNWTWMLSKALPSSGSECGKNLTMEIYANTGKYTEPRVEEWCF